MGSNYDKETLDHLRQYGPNLEQEYSRQLQTIQKNYGSWLSQQPDKQAAYKTMQVEAAKRAQTISTDGLKQMMDKKGIKQLDPTTLRSSLMEDYKNYEPDDKTILLTGATRDQLKAKYRTEQAPQNTETDIQKMAPYLNPVMQKKQTMNFEPEEISAAPKSAPASQPAQPQQTNQVQPASQQTPTSLNLPLPGPE